MKTKIAGVLLLAVLMVPAVVFAQAAPAPVSGTPTTAQLQAEIANLLAIVQQLEAQLAAQNAM